MSQQQRTTLDQMMREAPLDLGGDLHEQRALLVQMLTSAPLPPDVVTADRRLGDVPTVEIAVTGTDSSRVMLYFHGGAYALGTARTAVPLASDLARRIGAMAIAVEYRLAPEHPYPAALQDAVAAYRALLASGVPATGIVFAGESAGGGLVAATLAALSGAGLPQPAAAAVFSPWADLTLTGASLAGKAAVDPSLTPDGLRRRALDYLGGNDPADPLISPILADLTGLAPLLIQAGSHEILLDDATRLAARAAADDVEVSLQIWPGVPHVFQAFAAILDEGDAALTAASAFLTAHLTGHLTGHLTARLATGSPS